MFLEEDDDRFDRVHLWLGTVTDSEDQYEQYFEQDSLPEGVFCPFCKDIGLDEEYDEDYIGIIPLFPKVVSLNKLLEAVAKMKIPGFRKEMEQFLNSGAKILVRKAETYLKNEGKYKPV